MKNSKGQPVDVEALARDLAALVRKHSTPVNPRASTPSLADQGSGKALLIFPPERKPKD